MFIFDNLVWYRVEGRVVPCLIIAVDCVTIALTKDKMASSNTLLEEEKTEGEQQ